MLDGQFSSTLIAGELGSISAVTGPEDSPFDPYLYVMLHDENRVVAMDTRGEYTSVADLSDSAAGAPGPIAFDVLGRYGSVMYVGDIEDGSTCSVQPDGSVDLFGPPCTVVPTSLAFDPYGTFGGRLYFVDNKGDLQTVFPDGSVALYSADVGPRATMMFAPEGAFGPALYIADPDGRRILRLDPGHALGAPAPEWETETAELASLPPAPVSLALSSSGPFGIEVLYVVDETTRSVRRFGPQGNALGLFASELSDDVTIELPREGLFAGSMVMTIDDEIWVLRPRWSSTDLIGVLDAWGVCTEYDGCEADLDDDGDVDVIDLIRLLAGLD